MGQHGCPEIQDVWPSCWGLATIASHQDLFFKEISDLSGRAPA
jgi:hypothetical protein